MKCLTCGTFFPDDSVFCLVCGARVSETAETIASDGQTVNASSVGIPTARVFDTPSISSASTLQGSTHSASVPFSVPAASQIPQSPHHNTTTTAPTSHLAIVSIISAILAWMALPGIGSLVAVITGHMARREIRHSDGTLSGDSMAKAGLVLGYIQLTMTVLFICGAIVLFFIANTSAYFFDSHHFAAIITAQGIV